MFGQHDGKMMLTEIGRGSTNTIENAHGRLRCIRGRRSLQKMWRSLLLLCRWDEVPLKWIKWIKCDLFFNSSRN